MPALQRAFFSIFRCLCLRIFLRRFLTTEPIPTPGDGLPPFQQILLQKHQIVAVDYLRPVLVA